MESGEWNSGSGIRNPKHPGLSQMGRNISSPNIRTRLDFKFLLSNARIIIILSSPRSPELCACGALNSGV